MAEIAIEADAEIAELRGEIAFFASGVAGYPEDNVLTARAKDADSTFNIGIGMEILSAGDGGILRFDIGREVFVANGNMNVDMIDIIESIGVVEQMRFDNREEMLLGDGGGGKTAGIAGVGSGSAKDVETERVVIFFVIEGDVGLIETAARKGVEIDVATAANDVAELMVFESGRVDEHIFGSVATVDGQGNETDHSGGCFGECVARRVAENDNLEDTVGVFNKTLTGGAVVERLDARREIAVGFARTFGIGEFPTVDKGVGSRDAVIGAVDAFPRQKVDGDVVGEVVVGIGNSGIVVEIVFAKVTALHTSPDGVGFDVEDTVDGGDVAPGCVGTEFDLAGGEGKEGDGKKRQRMFH